MSSLATCFLLPKFLTERHNALVRVQRRLLVLEICLTVDEVCPVDIALRSYLETSEGSEHDNRGVLTGEISDRLVNSLVQADGVMVRLPNVWPGCPKRGLQVEHGLERRRMCHAGPRL